MKNNSTHVRCMDKKGRVVMVPVHLTTTRAFKIQGLSLAPLPESAPKAIQSPRPAAEAEPDLGAMELPPVTFPEVTTTTDDPVRGTTAAKGKPGRPKTKK